MTILDAMKERHSVRQYTNRALNQVMIAQLQHEIDLCNEKYGLHIQLVTNEPNAFSGILAHYGKFEGVCNYIALVGTKRADLDEIMGYCGEKIVLKAQMLGLNTCWVAATFSKKKADIRIASGERLVCVIALGYGANWGFPHKNKPIEKLYSAKGTVPQWFLNGMEAAMLAPTAMNQQKFRFILQENSVKAVSGSGFCTKLDLGIAKYHFEIGAGAENFRWSS